MMKTEHTYTLTTRRFTFTAARKLILWLAFIVIGCGVSEQEHGKETDEFSIAGTWKLSQLLFLSGQRVDVHTGYDYVWYRFFDADGTYYVAEIDSSDSWKPVKPHEMSEYFFMLSPYDTVYIEHGRMTDLSIIDHRTIGIDRGNYVEVYVKSNWLSDKRVAEIEQDIESTLRPKSNGKTQYIVPTPSSAAPSYVWAWMLLLVVIVGAGTIYIIFRVKANRQQPARVQDVAGKEDHGQPGQAFVHSDYFLALRQRLYEGPTLKQDEWEELKQQMKAADVPFFRCLAEKGQLSEVELRVCMLIRLGIPPSAISIHTCREQSSISSIRSRLYFKLFGKKGGAKVLDEFILSI